MRLMPFAAFLLLSASAMAWMDPLQFPQGNWQYRAQVLVNNAGSALTDYQIAVNTTNLVYNNTGLVGSWHFSEAGGTRFVDSSGNGNDGTYNGETLNNGTLTNFALNASSGRVDGGYGKALVFDGSDDFVNVGGIGIGGANTREFWFKPNNVAGNTNQYFMDMGGNNYWVQLYDVDGDGKLEIRAGGASSTYVNGVREFTNTSEWHHVAVTVSAGGTLSIYVDGTLDASGGITVGTPGALYLGRYSGAGSYYLNGIMDNVRIYNRALSASEIQQTYQNNTFIRSGLVGYWRFDEGAGTTAQDTHHIATEQNRDSTKSGNALSFDGANDYVDAGNGASLNANTQLTVEAWIKPMALPGQTTIVRKWEYQVDGSWGIQMGSPMGNDEIGMFILATPSDAGYNYGKTTDAHIPTDSWSHIVVTYDGSGASNAAKLLIYVNGVAKTLTFTGTIPSSLLTTTRPVWIGKFQGSYPMPFNGIIDEVRIYNRSLSSSEIQALYNASRMRLDYADLRFANASDATLPYWLESDNSAWVRMPSLAANSTTTVYTYYGNPNATSASNLTATFGTSNATSAIPGCTLNQACIISANQIISSSGTYGHPYVRINPGVTLRINGSGTVAYLEGIGRLDVYGSLVSTGGGTQSTGLSGSGGSGYCGSGAVAPGNGGTYWGNASGGNGGSGSYGPNGGGGGAGGTNGGGGGGGGGNGQCGCSGGSAGANYGGGGGYGGSANCGSSSGGGKGAFLSIKSPNVYVSGTINLTADNGRYNEGLGGEGGGGGALLELNASAFSLYGSIIVKAGEGSYGHNQGAGAGGGALAFLNYGALKGNGQINATAGSTGTTAWGAAGGGNAILALPTGTQPGAASGTAGGSANKSLAAGGSEPYATLLQEQQFSPFASLGISPANKSTYPNYPETFALNITNFQNSTDGFSLSCTGNCTYSESPASVGANQTKTVNVTITSANVSGTTNYTITATSQSNASNSATISASLTVDTTKWRDNWTDAYGNGFRYRIPIAVSNNGSALTDYQVNFTMDTLTPIGLGRMRGDCGDLRFTNGTNEMPYWVESGCNTASMKIWARVPSVPAGSSTVYAYYGNPSADSASNGTNTFAFFDDFSGAGIDTANKWDAPPASFSIDNGRLKLSLTSYGSSGQIVAKTFVFPSTGVLEGKAMFTNLASYDIVFILPKYADNSNQMYGNFQYAAGSDHRRYISVREGGSWTTDYAGCSGGNPTNDDNIWYLFKWTEYPAGTYAWDTQKANGTSRCVFNRTDAVGYTGKIALAGSTHPSLGDPALTAYWDDVRVRKSASPEPIALAGAEQTKGYRALVRRCGAKQPGANVTAYQAGNVSGSCLSDGNGICSLEISSGTYDLQFRFADNSAAWKNGTVFS